MGGCSFPLFPFLLLLPSFLFLVIFLGLFILPLELYITIITFSNRGYKRPNKQTSMFLVWPIQDLNKHTHRLLVINSSYSNCKKYLRLSNLVQCFHNEYRVTKKFEKFFFANMNINFSRKTQFHISNISEGVIHTG